MTIVFEKECWSCNEMSVVDDVTRRSLRADKILCHQCRSQWDKGLKRMAKEKRSLGAGLEVDFKNRKRRH